MFLPYDNKLDVSRLSQIFANTVATYKFYWFVSLLDWVVKEGRTRLSFWEVIAGMVAESWYPIHYYKLSFGKSDSLFEKSKEIQRVLGIPVDATKAEVRRQLLASLEGTSGRAAATSATATAASATTSATTSASATATATPATATAASATTSASATATATPAAATAAAATAASVTTSAPATATAPASAKAVGQARVALSLMRVFSLNVPYRFLSPWIPFTTNEEVVRQSQRFVNDCFYAIQLGTNAIQPGTNTISPDEIVINPKWIDYLNKHYVILYDFAYWNLALFLQKRNPNVPDLTSKLVKPISRDPLTRQHRFWDAFMAQVGSVRCIFSGKELEQGTYALDHFIPWSFVSHNLLWNLLPVDGSINSSKSDNLPPLDRYLAPYAQLHHAALRQLYPARPSDKLFEDYLTVYDSLPELIRLPDAEFLRVFQKTFSPLAQIAENMGFRYWDNPLF